MITFLACTCGEIHPSALIERDIGYICGNCEATAEGMHQSILAANVGRNSHAKVIMWTDMETQT